MRHALASLLVLALHLAFADEPRTYSGVFESRLVESTRGVSPAILVRATPEQLAQLPRKLKDGEEAYFGANHYYSREGGKLTVKRTIPLALIVADDAVSLYVNLDGEGAFKAEHQRVLTVAATGGTIEPRPGDMETWVDMPLPHGSLVESYPLHLIWSPEHAAGLTNLRKREQERYIWSSSLLLQGTADIEGRKVLVQYDLDPVTGHARVAGDYGIDANVDGRIDPYSKSEFVYRQPDAQPTVFEVGDVYVVHGAVKAADRKFVLEARTAADYSFFEMKIGNPMPDYTGVDIEGKTRRFSDFRGKYVLYDFWGTWCGPCVAEIPYLRAAYKKYRERGFEILGIDKDDDLGQVRRVLEKQQVTWPQISTATPVEGERLQAFITTNLRVQGFPTAILVDPSGKIISTGGKDEMPLRGPGLEQTLSALSWK